MATSITIRNVPEEVRDDLAARAARQGRSLQEFLLRQLADLTARPPIEDVIARARNRVRATGTSISASDIIAARDADRR